MDRLLEASSHAEARHFWFRGLDAGCGTGWNLRTLPPLAGGHASI